MVTVTLLIWIVAFYLDIRALRRRIKALEEEVKRKVSIPANGWRVLTMPPNISRVEIQRVTLPDGVHFLSPDGVSDQIIFLKPIEKKERV